MFGGSVGFVGATSMTCTLVDLGSLSMHCEITLVIGLKFKVVLFFGVYQDHNSFECFILF